MEQENANECASEGKGRKRIEMKTKEEEEGVEFIESSFDLTPKPIQRTLPLLTGLSSLALNTSIIIFPRSLPVDLSSPRFVILPHLRTPPADFDLDLDFDFGC